MPVADFCQYRIAHFDVFSLGQQGLVSVVFQERAHGVTAQQQGYGMTFFQQFHDFWEKLGIGKLYFYSLYGMIILHHFLLFFCYADFPSPSLMAIA